MHEDSAVLWQNFLLMGTSNSVLSIDSVSLTFPDGTRALEGASLGVEHGEFVSIIGPSGCGKSTLLRVVAGLQKTSSGAVSVERGDLAFVFQDSTLMPWRSVRRNVELLAELRGVPRTERRHAAEKALSMVGLVEFAEHLPATLSGGMKMRASVARSLTLKPSLFLLDEPFGSLDEITRERMNVEMLHVFDEMRFGALMVTHSISEAVYMSDRILVMSPRPGRVVASVPIEFSRPRDPDIRYSAEFGARCRQIGEVLRGAHS